jgi:hypothetical protein
MSQRTVAQQAAVGFVVLTTHGHVQRDLIGADRKRWHAALARFPRGVWPTHDADGTGNWSGVLPGDRRAALSVLLAT